MLDTGALASLRVTLIYVVYVLCSLDMAASGRILSSIFRVSLLVLTPSRSRTRSQAHRWLLQPYPPELRITRTVQFVHVIRKRAELPSPFPEDRVAATLGRDPGPSQPSGDLVLLINRLRVLTPVLTML